MMRATASETLGFRRAGGTGVSLRMDALTTSELPPINGSVPVAIS